MRFYHFIKNLINVIILVLKPFLYNASDSKDFSLCLPTYNVSIKWFLFGLSVIPSSGPIPFVEPLQPSSWPISFVEPLLSHCQIGVGPGSPRDLLLIEVSHGTKFRSTVLNMSVTGSSHIGEFLEAPSTKDS